MKPQRKNWKTQCDWDDHVWVDAPSKQRPGWIATACRKCGKFLGRRPSDDGNQPQQKKKREPFWWEL